MNEEEYLDEELSAIHCLEQHILKEFGTIREHIDKQNEKISERFIDIHKEQHNLTQKVDIKFNQVNSKMDSIN